MSKSKFSSVFCVAAVVGLSISGCQPGSTGEVASLQGHGTSLVHNKARDTVTVTCKLENPTIPFEKLSPEWKKTVKDIKYDEAGKTVTWVEPCTSEWKLREEVPEKGCASEICELNHIQVCKSQPTNPRHKNTYVWNNDVKACELEKEPPVVAAVPAAVVPQPEKVPAATKPVEAQAPVPVKPVEASAPPKPMNVPAPSTQAVAPVEKPLTAPADKVEANYKVTVKDGIPGHIRRFRKTIAENIAAKQPVCYLSSGTELLLHEAYFIQNEFDLDGRQVLLKATDSIPAGKKIGDPKPAPYDQYLHVVFAADAIDKSGNVCFKKGSRGYIFIGHFNYGEEIKEKCRERYKDEIKANGGNVFKECK